MYLCTETQEIRNKAYEEGNTPRLSPDWKNTAVIFFNTHLHEDINGKCVLDYGCGNGQIGDYFLEKGANVDFAEVASPMIELLRNKYSFQMELGNTLNEKKGGGEARVFGVESPIELPVENKRYDYVIVWSLFHHINPIKWKEFLDKFGELLKKSGKMFIIGLDETDVRLNEPGFKAFVTGKQLYPINSLPQYLEMDMFQIFETGTFNKTIAELDTITKTFRYFIVIKK